MQLNRTERHHTCIGSPNWLGRLNRQDEKMRATIILTMFIASLAYADWGDFREERQLELSAQGVTGIDVESHAGSLTVTGRAGSDSVVVTAIIDVPGHSDEQAKKLIANDLILTLEKEGDKAILKGYFEEGNWDWGDSPHVRLEVSIPGEFNLKIDDSSGSITVSDVAGDIDIDDSSGSIDMDDVGGVITIVDSSGSISVKGAGGSVSIEDGSGSIKVRDVAGSVTIDDGSGSISVKNVDQDLIILGDGSGSVKYANIAGVVDLD
jgi:hypothetical protein